MSTRKGRAYYTKFRDRVHLVEVVPIRPRGWCIFHDQKLSYRGIVFTYADAMAVIGEMRQRFLWNIQVHGPKDFIFRELPQEVPVRDTPHGVILPEESFQEAVPLEEPAASPLPPRESKPKPKVAPRSVLNKTVATPLERKQNA